MATPRRLSSRTPGRASRRDLDQFASLIRNPSTPQSTRRQIPLTSGGALARTPRGPSTPHALRALQNRAAARTPGKDRRKSSRLERETPIDILRNLGRKLAPATNPILSSSTSSSASSRPGSSSPANAEAAANDAAADFDFDFELEPEPEPDLERPRLSLSLEEMGITEEQDRDQSTISPDMQPPPRLSLAPFDEEYDEPDLDVTTRSIELPRERPRTQRLSTFPRISIGADAFEDLDGEEEALSDREVVVHDEADDDQTHLDFGREETENLDRFKLDFSFPTPDVTTIEAGADEGLHDDDNFQLEPIVDDFANDGFGSPDSSVAGGSVQLASDLEQEQDRPQPVQTLNPDTDTSSSSPEPRALQDSSVANNPRISKHGLPVPKVPSGIVKKIASRSAKGAKLNKETIKALDQATDWFFEQLSSDLSAYAAHANRKTIDESDVVTLMRRQRVVNKNTSVFALAQRNLPGELIQDLRLGRSKRR